MSSTTQMEDTAFSMACFSCLIHILSRAGENQQLLCLARMTPGSGFLTTPTCLTSNKKSQHIIRKPYNTLAISVISLSGFLREPLFHCVHAEANRSCNLLYRQTLLIEVLRRHLSLFFPTLCMTFCTAFCIAFISQIFHHFTHFAHSLRIFLQIPGLFGKDLKIHIIGAGAVEVVHQLANVRVVPVLTVYVQDYLSMHCLLYQSPFLDFGSFFVLSIYRL